MAMPDVPGRVLRLEISPSPLWLRIQFLFHGLALMVLAYPSGVPAALRLGLFLGLLLSLFRMVRAERLARVRQLILDGRGCWTLVDAEGRRKSLRLRNDTWIGPGMMVLRFDDGSRRPLSLVLFPDQLERDGFRRLRARLRQAPAETQAVSPPG